MCESYCTIKRPTVGRDSREGTTSDPFVAVNNTDKFPLPCSCSQMSANAQLLYAQRNVFIDTTIYLLQDPGCNPNDIMDVTGRDGVVRRYLVDSMMESDTRGRLWAVGCRHIRKPIAKNVPQ